MVAMALQSISNQSLSSLMGWLSFACWLLVYSPQIYENYRNKSGDGVSFYFILIWLIGDIANLFGAIKQNLLKTIIILAIYYTICDVVVLCQIFYYRHQRRKNQNPGGLILDDPSTSTTPIITTTDISNVNDQLRPSESNSNSTADGHHLNLNSTENLSSDLTESSPLLEHHSQDLDHESLNQTRVKKRSLINRFNQLLSNQNDQQTWWKSYITVYGLIILIGTVGWSVSERTQRPSSSINPGSSPPIPIDSDPHRDSNETWDFNAQILGWICAAAYLGSRVPQIFKNRITKCHGLSLLFILVGITGNLTYFASIVIADQSPTHILINLSWLVGSVGTLFFDFIVIYQFWIYRNEPNPIMINQGNI